MSFKIKLSAVDSPNSLVTSFENAHNLASWKLLTLKMIQKDFYCILKSQIFSYCTINDIFFALIGFQIGGTLQILW